jgi:hypothetical protein
LPRHPIHHLAVVAVAALGLAGSGSALAGKKKTGTKIRDLYYGEVLFQFFQDKDFEALTQLLVSRQAGRVTNHAAEAELLLGGLYLAYGQHDQAGEIFDRLLDESTDPLVRDRAWMYIGKARYERGQFAAADDAFARVGDALPRPLDSEYRMLRAQSLMAQDRFDEAAALLDNWKGAKHLRAYANYNLGVALVRMQQIDAGAKRLDEVGRTKGDEPELVSLRDKANLALGYAYLQAEQPTLARPVLERVRINGPFSNKALLGVGWADAMLEDYRSALNPWLELRDRDLLDSAVQESLLAVPYAFSRLDASGSAAEYYVNAMGSFDAELVKLDAAIARARSGELLPALLGGDNDEIGRWHWNLEELPDSDDARYLYHLIANHQFQDGLRSYRDLVALRRHLLEWHTKLETFEDMIETRRLAYAQRLPEVEARFAEVDVTELTARRDAVAARIERIERERDIVGLADEREATLWSDVTALETNAAFDKPKGAEARNKHRILKGTLMWQLDADYRYRLWLQKRGLAELDEQLTRARDYEARVLAARDQTPGELDEFANRIAMVSPRLEAMRAQISAVLDQQQDYLSVVAASELEAQKSRLASYRVQARFALATIYDQATVAQRAEGEPE